MEIEKSDLVVSLAGRDMGMLFYVIDTDGVYVSLVNGKERRVERPKRKKIRHVQRLPRPDTSLTAKIRAGERILNSELRKELALLRQTITVSSKEG